jgi:hypothetical protein
MYPTLLTDFVLVHNVGCSLLYGVLVAGKSAADPASYRQSLLLAAVAERWGQEALGRAVQVACIKTRIESAYGSSA